MADLIAKLSHSHKSKVAQKVTTSYSVTMTPLPPNVLAAARTLAGLSQGGLASRAGITRRTVLRAEQGLPIHERNHRAILETLKKHGVDVAVDEQAVHITRCAA